MPTDDGWCQAHDGRPVRHPCSIRRLAEMATQHLQRVHEHPADEPVDHVPPHRTAYAG